MRKKFEGEKGYAYLCSASLSACLALASLSKWSLYSLSKSPTRWLSCHLSCWTRSYVTDQHHVCGTGKNSPPRFSKQLDRLSLAVVSSIRFRSLQSQLGAFWYPSAFFLRLFAGFLISGILCLLPLPRKWMSHELSDSQSDKGHLQGPRVYCGPHQISSAACFGHSD